MHENKRNFETISTFLIIFWISLISGLWVFDTLSQYFGTLTSVSLVRVSEQYLTHCPPFLFYAIDRFRVGKSSVTFRFCKPYPYFTPLVNTERLYWGIFRQEPAIAKLDWLFTPTPKSSKYMHITLVRSSILLSKNFDLLRNRSSGFGSYPCD